MNRLQLVAIGLATLALTAGAAMAAPGNAPVDVPGEEDGHVETPDGHANETADESESAGAGPPADAGAPDDRPVVDGQGPPVDLPAQVPDFVSDIHQTISEHLSSAMDGLGDAVSDLTPDDGEEESSEGADGEATATPATTTAA